MLLEIDLMIGMTWWSCGSHYAPLPLAVSLGWPLWSLFQDSKVTAHLPRCSPKPHL